MFIGAATFGSTFPAGDHWVQWTCGGWVATDPTVSVAGTVSNTPSTQAPITMHATMNVEAQNAGSTNAPFGTTTRIYYSLSSPQTIHTQVQCVDPRAFGETAPVAAPARVSVTAQ